MNNNQNINNQKVSLDQEIANFLKTDYCENEFDSQKKSKSIYAILFYALMFFLLGSIVVVILQQFYIQTHNITDNMLDKNYVLYDRVIEKINNFSSAYGNLFIYIITLVVVLIIMKGYFKKDLIETKKFGFGRIIKYCAIGYVIFLGCSFIGNLFITIVGELLNMSAESGNEQGIIDIMSSGTSNLIGMSIATIILAPILEEIIFRKCLFNLLSPKFKPIWIIIISGLIFGSIHIIDPTILAIMDFAKNTGNFKSIIYEFSYLLVYGVMGISFGLVYQLSHRNLVVTIILHMINNFISVIYTIVSINLLM